MLGPHQLSRQISIHAPATAVWDVLMDARQLSAWAPLVHEVERCSDRETVGASRTCRVSFGSRQGRLVERVVEVEPGSSVTYVVDEDSFGMSRMLRGYGFRITLQPAGAVTTVRIDTFYAPRTPWVAVLNVLFLRRRMGSLVGQLLAGLREHVQTVVVHREVG
ncbi:MAG: SRPBCC family protein [Myxococcales bacterium]|nr:SRPBCC family protein [Myxococcales bacterium]